MNFQSESVQELSSYILQLAEPAEFITDTATKTNDSATQIVAIQASPMKVENYVTYYNWLDLVALLSVVFCIVYLVFATFVVPTRDFLIDHILAETMVV